MFEELEVRRLPSHHSLLLLCRQRCAHPVDVEVQPCAGLAERFHLIVCQERQVDFRNFHFFGVARAIFRVIAVDGRVDQLQPVEHAVVPHVDALGGHLAVDCIDAVQPVWPFVDVYQCLIDRLEGSIDHDLQIVVAFFHDEAWRRRRRGNLCLVAGERREFVRDVADRVVGLARFRPLELRICIVLAHSGTAGLGDEDVLVCADVVLQEPVGNDHVDPGRLHELCNLDLLDVSEVHDELERQVAGRLAGAALANRVPLDHHESLVKVGEHAQALVDESFAPQRFALAIEQNRIAFDLSQREVRFIRGDDEFQKLSYDVGGVIDLRGARKAGETADVGDQDDRLFSHSKKLSRCAAGLTVPLSRELSGATSGKSKRSCSGSEINRLRKETLNLGGVQELLHSIPAHNERN